MEKYVLRSLRSKVKFQELFKMIFFLTTTEFVIFRTFVGFQVEIQISRPTE